MFSARFHWDFKPNAIAEAVKQCRLSGARVLDLTLSDPTRAGIAYPPDISTALDDPRVLAYDPQPFGLREAREAVARYYSERGCEVSIDRVLLTASTSEAYSFLFQLLTDPGDHILAPRPSYPLFEFLANMESVEVRQYPLRYEGGWSIDLDALAESISPRTRAIVIVNPNNPTGSYLKRSELRAIEEMCARHEIAILCDEVFSDYALAAGRECVRTAVGVEGCLTFSMSGLSKVAGLPQMKLGWIVAAGPHELRSRAMERLELVADTYLSVGAPVQWAAARLLELGGQVQGGIRERVSRNLARARQLLADAPIGVLAVEGGWYVTLQPPRVRSEEEWVLKLLREEGVLVQPGFFYDFEGEAYLVLSLLTQPEVFDEGVARIRRVAEAG